MRPARAAASGPNPETISGISHGRWIEEARVVDLVVGATVFDRLAGEERAHDLDRLFEHLATHRDRWPAGPDDVLVERLAGPESEEEPSPKSNDVVAAAWAITAGWMRTIGHVTPTPTV